MLDTNLLQTFKELVHLSQAKSPSVFVQLWVFKPCHTKSIHYIEFKFFEGRVYHAMLFKYSNLYFFSLIRG